MGAIFPFLLFLCWIFTTVEENMAWTDDCEEQLLIAGYEGLIKFCPETNKTKYLDGTRYKRIFYSSRDDGTILAYDDTKILTFVQTNSANKTWTPHTVMDLKSQSLPCDSWISVYFTDMAVDWVTGIVYTTYNFDYMGCGKIRANDLKRSLFSTIHDVPNDPPKSIEAFSRGGILIWGQRSSILRALMDGTEVKLLIEVPEDSIGDLAVDQQTALVYWTNTRTSEVFQSDLEGSNRQKLDLLIQKALTGGFAVRNNIIFWQSDSYNPAKMYRTDVIKPEKRLVYTAYLSSDLDVLPGQDALDDFTDNPCANRSCSHICVQSNNHVGHTCLCPDDYAIDKDGHNCSLVRRHLLVSTMTEGIWQIPILHGNASEPKPLVKHAPMATGVQCDPVRRKIFWAEMVLSRMTKIWQADVESSEKGPEVVFEHFVSVRADHEELEAFAVDWATGNLYMAFHGERRFLACSRDNDSQKYSKCAELLGNQVRSSVGGFALDPTQGTMYWTEMDEDDVMMVMRGGMDGSWKEILKKGGQPTVVAVDHDHFRVYWFNQARARFQYTELSLNEHRSFELFKYKAYTPQHINIDGNNLYWVGLPKCGSSETVFKVELNSKYKTREDREITKYVDRDFTGVTGLWMCDADFAWTRRRKTCGHDRQCAGLCLLSGMDSFRCVCPIGFKSQGTNGSFCKEIEEPPVIYSLQWENYLRRANGSRKRIANKYGYIKRKNGSIEKVICEGLASSMAFDPLSRELFWSFTDQMNQTFRQSLMEMQNKGTMTAGKPFQFEALKSLTTSQLEYDWIGENLYFVNEHRGVGLCSTRRGECTIVIQSAVNIALDPPNGRMYWVESDSPGIWRGQMDGSVGNPIIPKVQAIALTVDHTSNWLFWCVQSLPRTTEVFYSDLNGKNIRPTVRLHASVWRIRVAGNRLWISFRSSQPAAGILSCDKETGDNLKAIIHFITLGQVVLVGDFLMESTPAEVQKDRDACVLAALCSHMCIPTPSGYMRCLCPTGYRLMPDAWTCECADANLCNTSNPVKPRTLRPSPTDPSPTETTQVVCKGNQFHCAVGICVGADKLCNGVPDCKDFSDEGARCNEACTDKHGCAHTCSSSPAGMLCLCPPDQTLASDNRSCVVLRTELGRAEVRLEGKWKAVLIAGGVLGFILAIVVAVVTIKYRQAKRERDLTQEELDEFLRGDPAGVTVAPEGVDRALLLPYTKILAPEDIIIARDTKLGSGEFGVVYPGIFKSEPVAIKVLKHSVDVDEFKAVLAEVKIMEYLGDHEFIVKFVGAEISEASKRKIMIVTELSPKGDLLKYLWKLASAGLEMPPRMHENVIGNPSRVTNLTLNVWCEQIATAMEYLAQKQIVHGDLAARNVLVFKDDVMKIADFGLSKQLYGCSTYQMKRERKLPWKWSSIELLTSREFSEASDVWAFGVTAWEIFALGQTPYKGITFGNTFLRYIEAGNRLPKPEHASEEIYKVLLECWDSERSNRPNFNRLKQIFHDFVSEQRGCMQPVVNTMVSEYVAAV